MGWAPGLVTTAGSLLKGVHLGRGGGSGSLKGLRNEEGGSGEQGLPISHLLNCTVEQAGSKENNLQPLNTAGRGRARREDSCIACQGQRGAGSEPRTGPHVGNDPDSRAGEAGPLSTRGANGGLPSVGTNPSCGSWGPGTQHKVVEQEGTPREQEPD